MPLFSIRLTRAKDQKYSDDRHQEIRLDEAYPDHRVLLHEANGPIPIIQPMVVAAALPSATRVKIVP